MNDNACINDSIAIHHLHTEQLAQLIADDAARSDVEVNCLQVGGNTVDGWVYDLERLSEESLIPLYSDRAFLDRSIRYLEMRGLIARVDPRRPSLVAFRRLSS